ncbi:MAG: EF-P lysine aminoacylase GenX [Kiritimatiellae bacterium]|nr:EF-P lysine aminoacylase GenX [Kiritimatiellia bacterium]
MNDSGPIDFTLLKARAAYLKTIRAFFDARGFCEVETPVRIPAPANEAFLEPPPAGDGRWLRTSPELHMKRLLAAGADKIYQIGPCFRDYECGRKHNPEFTMLEWYRPNESIHVLYEDVAALVSTVLGATLRPQIFHVAERYQTIAGWDPLTTWDEDRFDEDMVLKIEPSLPQEGLVYLVDYPAPAAALARLNPDDPRVAERFEAYLNGVEIANGYGELTEAVEQRQRFEATIRMREAHQLPTYPLDEAFLEALPTMPPTAGIALGIDRLIMIACGKHALAEVRPFCEIR